MSRIYKQPDSLGVKMVGLRSVVFFPHQDDETATDKTALWESFVDEELNAIWIILLEAPDSDAGDRGSWRIALHTENDRIVTLHPTESSTVKGAMDIIVRPICSMAQTAEKNDFQLMLKASAAHYARAVKPYTRTQDLFKVLETSGIRFYSLYEGRGSRFWLCFALYLFADLTKEPLTFDSLKEIAIHQMSMPRKNKEGELVDTTIKPGKPMPHKWTKNAVERHEQCRAKVEAVEERIKLFGY